MIHKHAVALVGLLTFLAWASACAQPSNAVEKSIVHGRPKQEKISELGDPAPPLTVQEWIKGKPVKMQPGTNIYVIVFCTLSRANELALTNLSSLQQKYQDKGVVVVAVSGESAVSLREFVQVRGADINFTVAADDDARKLTTSYQHAFHQMLLPRAYIVSKNNQVLWLGHPLRDDMGMVVDEITSGRYDLEQTRKNVITKGQMEQYLELARQDDPRTAKVGRIILSRRTNDAPALCDLAFQIATAPYIEKRDVPLATAALDRAAQLATTNNTDIAVDRAILLFQTGKLEAGLALAKQALATVQTEADRSEVNACIHAMEARLAAAKTNQPPAVKIGQTNAPPGKP